MGIFKEQDLYPNQATQGLCESGEQGGLRGWEVVGAVTQEELETHGSGIAHFIRKQNLQKREESSLANFYQGDESSPSGKLYFAVTRNKQHLRDEPLNEIHLMAASNQQSIKMPQGYSPISDQVLKKSETERYLLISR